MIRPVCTVLLIVFFASICSAASPLIEAAKNGEIQKVLSFIESGANLNVVDETGRTALNWAASQGHSEIVNLLAEHRADVNIRDKQGMSPLMTAAAGNHKIAAKAILRASPAQCPV